MDTADKLKFVMAKKQKVSLMRQDKSLYVQSLFAEAVRCYRSGQLQEAECCFQKILTIDPRHAESLHLLGLIAYKIGSYDIAVEMIGNAISSNDQEPFYHSNLGLALQMQGQLHQAVTSYRKAIDLRPDYPEAHNNLGNTLKQLGLLDDAASCYHKAIDFKPNYPEAYNNLGLALHVQEQFDEAVICYHNAIGLKPDFPEAHANLGNVLKKLGLLDDAVASYRKALDLRPDYPEAHNNLGLAFHKQGWLDEAVLCYRRAIDIRPNFSETYVNLGLVLQNQGRLDESAACYRKAIDIHPNFPEAHVALGTAFQDQGRLDEAVACYRKALDLKPTFPEAYTNLGNALHEQGHLDEAIACLRKALDLKPDYPEALSGLVFQSENICLWDGLDVLQEKLVVAGRKADGKIEPYALMGVPSTLADQLTCARSFGKKWEVPHSKMFHHARVSKHDKIRIGYLSNDFCTHAMAVLMAELFERHDRLRFETFAYSFGPDDQSPMRTRLIAAFDHFIEIGSLAHDAAAQRIFDDEIDILIDRKGYTAKCRPQILAYRPAPIQVNYLGYPGTMGQDFIDYIIADRFVAPMDEQPYYSERLVHLPDTYQPNTRREIAEHLPGRMECGLPENGFVFCCFNNCWKITPQFIAIWLRLLKAVPGSILWLLETNSLVSDNLRREAASRGIAPDRLIFAPRLALPEHLARHCQADLFLDTLPYNAHTTTSDALWAGLPVLTCTGDTFSGRVSTSLLNAIDLPELITASPANYEDLALTLATQPQRLANIRKKLGDNQTTTALFDTDRFARNIETAYTRMWENWRDGRRVEPFIIKNTENQK